MATKDKPAFRVFLQRDGKDAQLVRCGALWKGKNDSLTGRVDILGFSEPLRILVLPNRPDDEVAS